VAAVAVHLVVDVDLVNICLLFPTQSAFFRT